MSIGSGGISTMIATTIMTGVKPTCGQDILGQKTSVLRRIAGRPAALPQNCLTTEEKSRTALAFRPRHFSNIYSSANISFIGNCLSRVRNLSGANSSNQFARIVVG